MDAMVEKALKAKRESKYIEFKECFDPFSNQDWCEIIKDIVTISNSGGGIIVFGLRNNGEPSDKDINLIQSLDHATLIDKIFRYTGYQLLDLEIHESSKSNNDIVAFRIFPVKIPMVFIKPGTYEVQSGKQQTAFARGTVYFRHGSKSEPANMDDFRLVIERNLEEVRKEWKKGVRKVVEAPRGYKIQVLPPEIIASDSFEATPIRLVDDPSAQAYYKILPDKTHPFRQKDLITEVNKSVPPDFKINQFDMRVVRALYEIDNNEIFSYHPRFSSPQYSQALVDWLIEHFNENNQFFRDARLAFSRKRRS